MSATQHVIPLSAALTHGEEATWLEGQGLRRPIGWEQSRNPTPRELRNALVSLTEYEILSSLDGSDLCFQVSSPSEGTLVYLKGYAPKNDEDIPLAMHFDKGTAAWRLQVKITERLTHSCGPLLLAEMQFIIVEPGTPSDAHWHNWPDKQTIRH